MKRLYKSRKNKVIDGVCGGIAEYFDVDPVIVRIAFVLFLFLGGSGLLAYIIGMIIIPSEDSVLREEAGEEASPKPSAKEVKQKAISEPDRTASTGPSNNSLLIGIILVILGAIFLMGNFSLFHSPYWWVRKHLWDLIIPGIMIALGVGLLLRRK